MKKKLSVIIAMLVLLCMALSPGLLQHSIQGGESEAPNSSQHSDPGKESKSPNPSQHSIQGKASDSWRMVYEGVEKRPDNWKKIVKDVNFKLGDKYYKEEDEMSTGEWRGVWIYKYGTYPNIDGSTVAIPMAVEFARQHLDLSDDNARDFVCFNTTHDAYENLIRQVKTEGSVLWLPGETVGIGSNGEYFYDLHYLEPNIVDLIIVTEPSEEELALAKERNVTMITKPVCYDAFVFITHKDNPIDNLTIDQIQKIYTGEVTNWKEYGGADIPITAYQREENSGSQTAMENLVMQGKAMIAAPTVIDAMAGLVDIIADYQNRLSSIGYTYKYYIDNLYKDENIKTISIEGVAPTAENIRNGTYPFTTNYYGVIRSTDVGNTGGKFLDWMLSAEGQACIAQAGYIPMQD